MKKVSGLLKIGGAALLVPLVLLLSLLPAQAIGGTDVQLSLEGAGGPDLEVNADATYLALVYYEQDATNGRNGVYLKSAKASEGWASPRLLGFGSNPQVAFKPGAGSNVVYAVWVNADDTAIEATRCILNLTSAPTCGLAREVRKLPSGSVGALAEPDIVVDSSNVLHVAWQNAAVIETARSSNADNVDSWVITSGGLLPTLCGGGKASGPVLGTTAGKIHLAFLCGASATAPSSVEYRRSLTSSHNWSDKFPYVSFTTGSTAGDAINTANTRLGNLALNASGSQVSLAWNGQLSSPTTQYFSLMYVASTDAGQNWGTVVYIPSSPAVPAINNPQVNNQQKLSTNSTLPPQEFGLRPSLVVSGTLGNAAVAWQQKLNDGVCQQAENGSSDIHFSDPQTSAASPATLEHASKTDYSIDPDLAVGPAGVPHFVFMKDDSASACIGGTAAAYAIYYRGPITKTISGHLQPAGGVFLPVIRK